MRRFIAAVALVALAACEKKSEQKPEQPSARAAAPEDSSALFAPYVPASGVDTIVSGDTTKFVYWSTHIDSSKVTVKPPPVFTDYTKPFGGYGQMNMEGAPPYTPFTAASNNTSANGMVSTLAEARDNKMRIILAMPCGSHNLTRPGNCLRDSANTVVFSWKRFDSTLASFATPVNVAAVQKAYAEGWLLGINTMDEPWVKGGGDGNTWGPTGLSRAQADTVCKKMKAAFPKVPVGLSDVSYKIWPITAYGGFKFCDFGIPQFSYRMGDATKWADSLFGTANKYGYMLMFSFNPINGGTQDKTGAWDCPNGYRGQRSPNCMMTPTQIISVVDKLGDRGCGPQLFWRWDDIRFDVGGYGAAWSSAAQKQKSRQSKPCKRR